MAVRIVTDSACSIDQADIDRLSISIVPLHISLDGTELTAAQLEVPAFYERLADMAHLPQTSQPSPEEFQRVFRAPAEKGDEVLAILISAGMSGTVAAAELGATLVRDEYPEARIEVVDSRSNSLEEGFAVLAAARAAAGGASLDECVAAARATIARTRFLFTPHSLEYLARGGRISGAARLLGVALNVAPILTARKGATGVAGVARSGHAAWKRIAALMRADVAEYGLRQAAVQYVGDLREAMAFAVESIAPLLGTEPELVPIPPVVGLHVGPALGVVYETERPLR